MSQEQTITYELDGEIALVGLNRPDKRNSFNPTVMKQLREAIERAGEEAKCGIIFGHGDNFCAGLDLRWAAQNWKTGSSQRLPFPFPRKTYFEEMARGNIPFIAALHGATLGGGLETAAAAHIRVADETTYFGLPEGTRGIFIGGGGSATSTRAWPKARSCSWTAAPRRCPIDPTATGSGRRCSTRCRRRWPSATMKSSARWRRSVR